ncbi:MAG: translin family protein [Actinomycetota bacterium]|nr:translin family protein [Actinomycetota bacterium]
MELNALGESLRAHLDAKTQAREQGLASSRSAIRSCGNAIRAMHRYEMESASDLLSDAQKHLDDARRSLSEHDDMRHAGFVHDAEKELAEARITFALVTDGSLPSPEDLGLPPSAYLKGMAESVGELRRHILDLMRHGHLDQCESLLGAMDDIYYLLVSMDYPDGITFGLRRLTDVARSIIERTRGDFTTAAIQSGLRDALTEHGSKLDA